MKVSILYILTALLAILANHLLLTDLWGLESPVNANSDPREQEHSEIITSAPFSYEINVAGNVDITSSRGPVGYLPWSQAVETMRSVTIENLGSQEIVNPRLAVNGKAIPQSTSELVAEALRLFEEPAVMKDRDKARAIFEFWRRSKFHGASTQTQPMDPLQAYHTFGFTLCGDESFILRDLFALAGLKSRRRLPVGHRVVEVWYQGDWHLFDGDEHVIVLERDNQTIASVDEIIRDHDLLKRTHTYGIGSKRDRMRDEFSASLYVEGLKATEPKDSVHERTSSLSLRPGEGLTWSWMNNGKMRVSKDTLGALAEREIAHNFSNGKWIYTPMLSGTPNESGILKMENMEYASNTGLIPKEVGKVGFALWRVQAPYLMVGGTIKAKLSTAKGGFAAVFLSNDGKTWERVLDAEIGDNEYTKSIDEFLSETNTLSFGYFIRVDLVQGVGSDRTQLHSLTFENDLQMAPLNLPALLLGKNTLTYSDDTVQARHLQVTHRWNEYTQIHPPAAPKAALHPGSGSTNSGSKVNFKWTAAQDKNDDNIVDYQFILSENAALRWPLSSNFETLVSDTTANILPKLSLPYEGLLNPDTIYYWKVRAKDASGLWGAWSDIWNFRISAPAVLKNLKIIKVAERVFLLAWERSTLGSEATHFEIYGSNEKGFSASAVPYEVNTGNQKGKGLYKNEKENFAGNLIDKTDKLEWKFTPKHGFYRVIAVDSKGNKSAPSDYIEAPRPFIFSEPPKKLVLGEDFAYEVKSTFSNGDLTAKPHRESLYNTAFWSYETPRIRIVEAPTWIRLDGGRGLLFGKPTVAGVYRFVLEVSIQGRGIDVQEFFLQVSQS